MKNRGKISKNCVLVFGKVKQNSDGEVRISLGKWSNLLGKWSKLLGRWSNLLGKWSKFDGEMKQNDGQMKQNLMGRCPIDKVHTTLVNLPQRTGTRGSGTGGTVAWVLGCILCKFEAGSGSVQQFSRGKPPPIINMRTSALQLRVACIQFCKI